MEFGDPCFGNRLLTDGLRFGLYQWASKLSFSSSCVFEFNSLYWPTPSLIQLYLMTTQFGIYHLRYTTYCTLSDTLYSSMDIPKWTGIPKYTPQYQEQSAMKEQTFISHLLIYWTPSAPNSASLSEFGLWCIGKMSYDGLVWVYEPFNSCVMEEIRKTVVTWPGITES